jgi:hypothetical protein
MTLAHRAAALDVYSAFGVPGAREWMTTGDASHLPRVWREQLDTAAKKIARWTDPPPVEVRALPPAVRPS